MILFKPEHVPMILSGRKTQTRRMGKKRWNVGVIHQARTKMMVKDSTFAKLRILSVHKERVTEISDKDALAEGYENNSDFLMVFKRINKTTFMDMAFMDVWVVKFEVAEQ